MASVYWKALQFRIRPDLATRVVPSFPRLPYYDWQLRHLVIGEQYTVSV